MHSIVNLGSYFIDKSLSNSLEYSWIIIHSNWDGLFLNFWVIYGNFTQLVIRGANATLFLGCCGQNGQTNGRNEDAFINIDKVWG